LKKNGDEPRKRRPPRIFNRVCPTCGGGGRWTRETPEGLTFREECPDCEGTGISGAMNREAHKREGYYDRGIF